MSDVQHRPSLVLELHPSRWMWCLGCSKPWPCPSILEQQKEST